MSTRAQRVCQMNGCYASFGFSIKCLMKNQPYLVLLTNLVISTFYFGYLIRMFDQDLSTTSEQNFNQITNPVWMAIVTMTTVGYGDFFPKSIPSRILGIICAFYGVYLVSLFLITLDNLLKLDQSETRSYELISRLENKEALKLEAVNVITTGFRHKRAKRKAEEAGSPNSSYVSKKLKLFRKYLLRFSQIAKALRGNYGTETPEDGVRRELEDLRSSISSFEACVKVLGKHLEVEMPERKPTDVGIYHKGSTDDVTNDLKKES
mmetsp:Transcript_14073/g.14058  ORF Transcript_14073/g.14058 Transcript_14073/m.14058 type:complete len:264 (-) Transcript_14073:108-899(-)